jgi:hypothetical protein
MSSIVTSTASFKLYVHRSSRGGFFFFLILRSSSYTISNESERSCCGNRERLQSEQAGPVRSNACRGYAHICIFQRADTDGEVMRNHGLIILNFSPI